MKKNLAGLIALTMSLAMSAQNPAADPAAVFIDGNARFTVLTPEMIRIEYSPTATFEDNATFAVINRNLPVPNHETSRTKDTFSLTTDKLTLNYRSGADLRSNPEALTISFDLGGDCVEWHPGMEDPLNLKGTYRTLDGNNGDSHRKLLENGIISRSGWAVIDDSPSTLRADGSRSLALVPSDNAIDWVAPRADSDALDLYFLGYGHDYKRALKDFTRIAGNIPLPPDYVFGYWYSKYENYTADDFRRIVRSLRDNDINADVMILDMDWHWNGEKEVSDGRGGWTGWSWNTKLIPDPDALLSDIHAEKMHIALNLHPADGVNAGEDIYNDVASRMSLDPATRQTIPWKLEDKNFKQGFFDSFIRSFEKQGVDFWWLDWQQHLVSPYTDGLGETFWCNHVFFNDMKYNRPDHRPLIFHRWGGLGSHRYQVGFSGDTFINYPTLAFLPYFTATASNVGYGYWGHDIGGHQSDGQQDVNDPELLQRWIQAGVFTPIFRTHATKGTYINRMIWTYDNFAQMNDAVKLRYALFPYLYTMARKSHDTGVGICRPLYYEYPELDQAYTNENEYFFGDDILVAPVVEPSVNGVSTKRVWLPEGQWWSVAHSRMIGGGEHTLDYTLEQIPYFYRSGAIIVNNPPEAKSTTDRPGRMILHVVAGADGATDHYEDAGDSNNYETEHAFTHIAQTTKKGKTTVTIGPRRGSYAGMPQSRAWTMKIFNTDSPRQVKVNGRKAPADYDSATRCTTVELPAADPSKSQKVEIAI
ncbi:MAG: glycoside hydrolase family 31 protein [Clostridium sp.]|nr:glycoside hydrolase family 31 protein [Clostridium sp.]